jgi:hypothetical protein
MDVTQASVLEPDPILEIVRKKGRTDHEQLERELYYVGNSLSKVLSILCAENDVEKYAVDNKMLSFVSAETCTITLDQVLNIHKSCNSHAFFLLVCTESM